MQKAYGDVETNQYLAPGRYHLGNHPSIQQIEQGKILAQDPNSRIDELEKAAAEEVARRHPRGPR
jgi:hypothetical protein